MKAASEGELNETGGGRRRIPYVTFSLFKTMFKSYKPVHCFLTADTHKCYFEIVHLSIKANYKFQIYNSACRFPTDAS